MGVGSDKVGLSFAYRQFETEGISRFNGLNNDIWQGVLQWRPLASTQAFVQLQEFNSLRGETFYPADFLQGSNNLIDEKSQITRLGLRHTLTGDGKSELRGLWGSQKYEQGGTVEDLAGPPAFPAQTANGKSHSQELQYRRSGTMYITHLGVQSVLERAIFANGDGSPSDNRNIKSQHAYLAWQQNINPDWQLDAQMAWAKIDNQDVLTNGESSTLLQRWLPKLGIVYTPYTATHLRLAAWRNMGVSNVGNAALAPVSLAGILLNRPGDNGKVVEAIALSADSQLSGAWLLSAQAQQREVNAAIRDTATGQQTLLIQKMDEAKLALHWQPGANPWALSFMYEYESILNDPTFLELDAVDQQKLRSQQIVLRWFANAQWTANLTVSRNRTDGVQKSRDPDTFQPTLVSYLDNFKQVDASLSWQFNNQQGSLTAGVRNATDTNFQYTDTDKLNPRFSKGRLLYTKLKLVF